MSQFKILRIGDAIKGHPRMAEGTRFGKEGYGKSLSDRGTPLGDLLFRQRNYYGLKFGWPPTEGGIVRDLTIGPSIFREFKFDRYAFAQFTYFDTPRKTPEKNEKRVNIAAFYWTMQSGATNPVLTLDELHNWDKRLNHATQIADKFKVSPYALAFKMRELSSDNIDIAAFFWATQQGLSDNDIRSFMKGLENDLPTYERDAVDHGHIQLREESPFGPIEFISDGFNIKPNLPFELHFPPFID